LHASQDSAFPGQDAAALGAFHFKAGHATLVRLLVSAGQADTGAPGPTAEAAASTAATPTTAALAATLAATLTTSLATSWTSLLRKY
jgi:hypothetical protein